MYFFHVFIHRYFNNFPLGFCHKDNLLKPEFQQNIRRQAHVGQPFFWLLDVGVCLPATQKQPGYTTLDGELFVFAACATPFSNTTPVHTCIHHNIRYISYSTWKSWAWFKLRLTSNPHITSLSLASPPGRRHGSLAGAYSQQANIAVKTSYLIGYKCDIVCA